MVVGCCFAVRCFARGLGEILQSKMADRRRRRRNSSNTESENSEGEENVKEKVNVGTTIISECESEQTQGEETSEYESTTEGPDEDDEDDETETEDEDDDDETTEDFDDDDDVIIEDDDGIDEERQSGDGEEEPDKLDDDEDKKNPAYIPRRGAFYEHDTRISEDAKEEVKEQPKPKQALWQDHGKWSHDRFQGEQQAPKSREEIIAIYGYDIRSHERPPENNFRGKNRHRGPDSRKQLRDFMQPQDGSGDAYGEDNRGNDRPYGRGGWRGRGGGGRGQRYNNNRDYHNRSYTDYKNSQNRDRDFQQDHSPYSKPSLSDYNNRNNDGGANDSYGRGQRSDRDFDNGGYGNRDHRPKSQTPDRVHSPHVQHGVQLQQKPMPPDVVPTSHIVESYIAESAVEAMDPNAIEPATTQTVRSKFRRGYDRDHKAVPRDGAGMRDNRSRDTNKDGHRDLPYKDEYYRDNRDYHRDNRENIKEGFGDRKSYSKDRRNKTGRTHRQDYSEPGDGSKPTVTQQSTEQEEKTVKPSTGVQQNTPTISSAKVAATDPVVMSIYPPVTSNLTSTTPSGDKKVAFPPAPKPLDLSSQNRPKRYSSQRQRPQPEAGSYAGDNPPETVTTQPAPGPPPAVSLATVPVQNPRHVTPPVPGHAFFPRPVFGQQQQQQQPVFRNPRPTTTAPPLSISFPPPPVITTPIQSVPFTIPASSNVQSPPRLHIQPPVSVATVTMTPTAPNPGTQPIIQGAYVAAPVVNYGPPSHQGPPSHYQMATPMPIQFPAAPIAKPFPPAPSIPQGPGPDPILIRGGTTYFSTEAQPFRGGTTYFSPQAQQPSPSRVPVSRRPKAAIPIINPQEIPLSQEEYYEGDMYEYGPEDVDQFMPQGGEYLQQVEPPQGYPIQDQEYPTEAAEGYYGDKQPSDTDSVNKNVSASSLSAMAQEFQQSCSVQSQEDSGSGNVAGTSSEQNVSETATDANAPDCRVHEEQTIEHGNSELKSGSESEAISQITDGPSYDHSHDNDLEESQGQDCSADDRVHSGQNPDHIDPTTTVDSSTVPHTNNSDTTQCENETETPDSLNQCLDSGNSASENRAEESLPNQSKEKIVTEIKLVYKEAKET